MIRTEKVPIVGDGLNRRSMVFTENLVQGMILASTKEIASGETYWIADEAPYTMNEIIDTIESLLANEFSMECNYGRIKLPGFVSIIAEKLDALLQRHGALSSKDSCFYPK